MKADLSRGHNPDRKRGKSYRRVLLQQGRLLLDSDLAAMTDAIDAGLRDMARDVAGAAGTPDLGFLVTPGPVVALFDTLDGVTRDPASNALFEVHLDHGAKYLGRLPSLYLGGVNGWGKVSISGALRPAGVAILRIWARIPAGTALIVRAGGGQQTINGTSATAFNVYDAILPNASPITIEFSDTGAGPIVGREAWIGLIEGYQAAGTAPRLWVRQGRYMIDGLPIELAADGRFPEVSFEPAPDAPLAHVDQANGAPVDQLYIAYLEGYERLLTQVEDAGMLEQALGGAVDTCARSRAVGQVKVVPCGALSASAIPGIFRTIKLTQGALTVTAESQASVQDPCAIPEVEGYTGGDNRLYRFEVHEGGTFNNFKIKWSRNNGSEVFGVLSITNGGTASRIELAPGANLRDGDLVELLSEDVEVRDAAPASVDAAGLTPPIRAVGELYYVRELPDTPGEIELLDSAGNAVTLGASWSAQPILKLRRWHGLLRAADAPVQTSGPPGSEDQFRTYTVDGIKVTVEKPWMAVVPELDTASFMRPGEYWQYEARRLYANDNGPWVSQPHGPERLFAPLALLRYKGQGLPLELVQWYGSAFQPLGALDADHVAFDGAKAGSLSRTVQEALDELYARHDDGCCYVDMEPSATIVDDAARILEIIQTRMPTGGVICLRPGLYRLRSVLTITNIKIELRGCPDAVIVSDASGQTPLVVDSGGTLVLNGVVYCTNQVANPGEGLVDVKSTGALLAEACGLFHLGGTNGGTPGIAVQADSATPVDVYIDDGTYVIPYPLPTQPVGDLTTTPRITLKDCVVVAGCAIASDNLQALTIQGCVCHTSLGVVCVQGEAGQLELASSVLATDLSASSFTTLWSYQPTVVAAQVTALLETVVLPSSPVRAAFYVNELFGGFVTDSSFFGGLGFCARYAREVEFRGNRYAGNHGMRLDNAVEVKLTGEHIEVQAGYRPDPVGIMIVRAALDLVIASCTIRAAGDQYYLGRGICIGTRFFASETHGRRLQGVLVNGNHVRATGAGVQIRSWNDSEIVSVDDAIRGLADDISIWGNYLEVVGEQGIVCARDVAAAESDGPNIVIAGNHIQAPVGYVNTYYCVHLYEASCVKVTGNHLIVRGEGSSRAIQVWSSPRLFISGNSVYIDGGSDVVAGATRQGMYIDSSENVTISGNRFSGRGNSRTFEIWYCDYLTVDGNDFGYAYRQSNIHYCMEMVFRGNRISSNLRIFAIGSTADQGHVSDNDIHYGGQQATPTPSNAVIGTGTHLIVENTTGYWKISGNNVYGYLVVRPAGASGTEGELHAHVEGNSAWRLIVAYYSTSSSSFFTPHASSRVAVVGNLATQDEILVNNYAQLLMSGNRGPDLWVGTTAVGTSGQVIGNNHNF